MKTLLSLMIVVATSNAMAFGPTNLTPTPDVSGAGKRAVVVRAAQQIDPVSFPKKSLTDVNFLGDDTFRVYNLKTSCEFEVQLGTVKSHGQDIKVVTPLTPIECA